MLVEAGCHQASTKFIELPKVNITLEVDSVYSNTILEAIGIIATDDYVVLMNHKKDTLFDVFDNKSGKYLYSNLTYGQGPKDMAPFLNIYSLEKNDIYATGLGAATLTMMKVNEQHLDITEKKKLPLEETLYQTIYLLDDDRIMVKSTNEDAEWFFYNGNTGEFIGDCFFTLSNIIGDHKSNDNNMMKLADRRCSVAVNRERGRIAIFYIWFPYMKILDTSGNVVFETSVGVPANQIKYEPDIMKRSYHFHKCVGTKDYLFVGYPTGDSSADYFQVWNWDGELLHILKIPGGMNAFTVTPDAKRIYGIKTDSDWLYYCDLALQSDKR